MSKEPKYIFEESMVKCYRSDMYIEKDECLRCDYHVNGAYPLYGFPARCSYEKEKDRKQMNDKQLQTLLQQIAEDIETNPKVRERIEECYWKYGRLEPEELLKIIDRKK